MNAMLQVYVSRELLAFRARSLVKLGVISNESYEDLIQVLNDTPDVKLPTPTLDEVLNTKLQEMEDRLMDKIHTAIDTYIAR